MRIFKAMFLLVVLLAVSVGAVSQTRRFTTDNIDYVLEFPSEAWQVVSRLDVHDHREFINGDDPTNGWLHVRKIFVDQPTSTTELFTHQERWELQRLRGYVVCSECEGVKFEGRLSGAVFAYEYVAAGRAMYGRIYYLQVDSRTFYSLRFTAARDKLQAVRDHMHLIAQSFRLK